MLEAILSARTWSVGQIWVEAVKFHRLSFRITVMRWWDFLIGLILIQLFDHSRLTRPLVWDLSVLMKVVPPFFIFATIGGVFFIFGATGVASLLLWAWGNCIIKIGIVFNWSMDKRVWLLTMGLRVRFSALQKLEMWIMSATEFTKPREDNWVATWLRSRESD